VNLTNYNSTLVEITGITGKFKSVIAVIPATAEGSDRVEWVHASGAFKSYTDDGTSGVPAETADDVDVGEFDFIAVGTI
jgi:hypothetical protein